MPLGPLTDTILLKTHRMNRVDIDPLARTARVEAGTVWSDVVQAAAKHGLAALPGSSRNVGVAGYTLGGGVSFLGRKYGLSASNVRAIEVVTADGQLRRADREHEPDLFWALPRRRQLRHRHRAGAAAVPGHPAVRRASCGTRSNADPRCCTPGRDSPAARSRTS